MPRTKKFVSKPKFIKKQICSCEQDNKCVRTETTSVWKKWQ